MPTGEPRASTTEATLRGTDAYGPRDCRNGGWSTERIPTTYNRSWDQFLNRQNQWDRDQRNRWERTLTTSLLGGA